MKNQPEFVTGKVKMVVSGVPAALELSVPAAKVKPTRMLPVFQKMTDSFVKIAVDKTTEEGKEISCKAGCGACCRQVVPIAKIEAYQIAKLVRNLPALKRRMVVERFEKACETLADWFEKLEDRSKMSSGRKQQIGMEYFHKGIACPFLEDESCSIHADRPLACREYLVTSPPDNCSSPTAENVDMIALGRKVSAALHKLSADELAGDKSGYIPLIKALRWTKENPGRFRLRSGPGWMGIMLKKLEPKRNSGKLANEL